MVPGHGGTANCVSAERTEPGKYRIVRHRWAGLLLEEAELAASPALMTVATDAVPALVKVLEGMGVLP